MRLTSTFKKAPRLLVAAAAMSTLSVGAVALTGSPASAAGTLTGVTMSVSNNATSAGGATNTAFYTWNFTTATIGPLTSLTMTVPTGTVGAALTLNGATFGLTGCTVGTPTLATTVVTVPLTGTCAVPALTPVSISIAGFTNSPTVAAAFQSVVTTSAGDTGTATLPGVNFNNNTTAVTIVVPDSLTFVNGNTAITLLPVPGILGTSPAVPLTISTNAKSGYSLSGCVTTDFSNGAGSTIPEASNLAAAPLSTTATAFAAQAAKTSTNGTLQAPWLSANGLNYLGYAATCGTGTGQKIFNNPGPTASDVITLTNSVGISATQANGTYTGSIAYQVSPSY